MGPSGNNSFSDQIDCIRSILVKTLSSENVSKYDVLKARNFERVQKKHSNHHVVDKEARLRYVKERQNEERQRKLEEIKAQALAAQRFKEQKEQERRQRLEEMRLKEDTRRHQVEERKKAISDAERNRLESILHRNQEREARIDLRKKHERSNIVFAFGSSTPRNLDPTDASVSFWGARRATSTQNIMSSSMTGSTLTRRQSERELDSGSKKRATSAGGIDRSVEGSISPSIPAGSPSGYLGRRRTDLVPTIPSRDSSFHSSTSRRSLNQSPGRAYSMTRLDQLAKPRKTSGGLPALNESSLAPNRSVTRSMSHLAHVGKAPSSRSPGLNKSDSRSMHHLSVGDGRPVAPPRVNRAAQLRQQKLLLAQQSSSASEASSRPSSSMSQQSTTSVTNSVNIRHRKSATPRRPRPASIAGTGVTIPDQKESKPPLPTARKSVTKSRESSIIKSKSKEILAKSDSKPELRKKIEEKSKEKTERSVRNIGKVEVKTPPEPVPKTEIKVEENKSIQKVENTIEENNVSEKSESNIKINEPSDNQTFESKETENESTYSSETKVKQQLIEKHQETAEFIKQEIKHQEEIHPIQPSEQLEKPPVATPEPTPQVVIEEPKSEQKEVAPEVTPVTAKPKEGENGENIMTTSMTKSRITNEEEAKAALAEKRRLAREEAERKAREEAERIEAEQRAELEKQRREEEEIHNLAQMQRQAEQERLQEAIREAQKREEEERLKREEEQRLKLLKEEADKKAREEAERQKLELQKKLENEEKEREKRRQRVQNIMSRIGGKNNTNSQQNSQDQNENKPENKINDEESKLNEENKLNGTKQENGTKEKEQENGTKEKEQENGMVDNIIPDGSVKNNANTIINDEQISTADTINSNNAWQASQQYGSTNLVCNNNS